MKSTEASASAVNTSLGIELGCPKSKETQDRSVAPKKAICSNPSRTKIMSFLADLHPNINIKYINIISITCFVFSEIVELKSNEPELDRPLFVEFC